MADELERIVSLRDDLSEGSDEEGGGALRSSCLLEDLPLPLAGMEGVDDVAAVLAGQWGEDDPFDASRRAEQLWEDEATPSGLAVLSDAERALPAFRKDGPEEGEDARERVRPSDAPDADGVARQAAGGGDEERALSLLSWLRNAQSAVASGQAPPTADDESDWESDSGDEDPEDRGANAGRRRPRSMQSSAAGQPVKRQVGSATSAVGAAGAAGVAPLRPQHVAPAQQRPQVHALLRGAPIEEEFAAMEEQTRRDRHQFERLAEDLGNALRDVARRGGAGR